MHQVVDRCRFCQIDRDAPEAPLASGASSYLPPQPPQNRDLVRNRGIVAGDLPRPRSDD